MTNFFKNTPTPPLLEKNPDDSCTNPSILKKFIYYLLIFGTGIINAFLNPYFFRFLSSILFTTEELHFFAFSPLFSPSLLLFLVFYLITEIITVSVLTSYFLRHFYYDSKNFLLSFAVIVAIFIIIQTAVISTNFLIEGRKYESKQEKEKIQQEEILNDIANITQTKSYDFSNTILISNRKSYKLNIAAMDNNKAVWIEQTKNYPLFPKNVWDVYIFEFNPKISNGNIIKASDLSDAKNTSPENVNIFNNEIYWTQDLDLYKYDYTSKGPILVLKNAGNLLEKYESTLILLNNSLLSYNLLTKQTNKLDFNKFAEDSVLKRSSFNKNKICYPYNSRSLGIYNTETKSNTLFSLKSNNIISDPLLEVIDCSDNYITYNSSGEINEIGVYDFKNQKNIFTKKYSKLISGVHAKLNNNKLFYSLYSYASDPQYTSHSDIYQVDLNSISEKIILSEDNLVISGISPRKYWDTNGKYLIYFKETGVKFVHYIYFKNIEN